MCPVEPKQELGDQHWSTKVRSSVIHSRKKWEWLVPTCESEHSVVRPCRVTPSGLAREGNSGQAAGWVSLHTTVMPRDGSPTQKVKVQGPRSLRPLGEQNSTGHRDRK